MPLNAGGLRHRITIEQPKYSQDVQTGERQTTWRPFLTDIAASYRPSSAREFVSAQAMQSEVVGTFVIRYRTGIKANMRIKFRGQIFNIAGVLPDDKSGLEWITLPVSTGVSEG